jgi:hypothetical protein
MTIKNNLKNPLLIFVFLLFIAIGFFNVSKHHPWRDEAQSWLIIRDLNFIEMIKQMPYEGTPPLWHIVTKPLVELNLPYSSQNWLHFGLALISVFLLLFAISLPKVIKVLLTFNYYFLFEYVVIARNYNLSILLLFSLLLVYRDRLNRPLLYSFLIFLLALTNIHSLMAALILAAYFLFEICQTKRISLRRKFAVLMAFSGPALSILMLLPAADQSSDFIFKGWQFLVISSAAALLPIVNLNNYNYLGLLFFIWPILISYLLFSKKSQIFFLGSTLWLFFIFLYKHSGYLRHYGLILVFLIFAIALDVIEKDTGKKRPDNYYQAGIILLATILSVNVVYSAFFLFKHSSEHFSGSKEMAQYLQKTNLLSEEIASYPSYIGISLLPYLENKKMYQPEIQDVGTFITWSDDYYNGLYSPFPILQEKMKTYYLHRDPPVESILFLTSDRIENNYLDNWELLYHNTKSSLVKDEFFYLYRVKLNN